MEMHSRQGSVRPLVLVTFVVMIVVNGLANVLPLNGKLTGDVSDAYRNLFAPAGLTFAIWGVIYVLLACHTLYQMGLFRSDGRNRHTVLLNKVGFLFSISSLANAAWIFSWHYDVIAVSMLMMLVILVCLTGITRMLETVRLSSRERFFIRLPFSVYFGWITVATIANATVLLVSLDWTRFGLTEVVWAIVMISIGAIIGTVVMIRNRDTAYGLVLVWAYAGILIKHVSVDGFFGAYPPVIYATAACLVVFAAGGAYTLGARKRKALAVH